jgi:hypothetical protein
MQVNIHNVLLKLQMSFIPAAEDQSFAHKLLDNFDFLLASFFGHIQPVSERMVFDELAQKECLQGEVIFANNRHVLEKLWFKLPLLNNLPQDELVKLHSEGFKLILHNDLRHYLCRVNVTIHQRKQVRYMGFQCRLGRGGLHHIVE